MDGYQYRYCLPPAGGRIRSQGNYCLPPAGVWLSQNKVIKYAAHGVSHKGGGRGMGRWVGLQKLITVLDLKNGYKGGVRVGFINIIDMYNNDVGKGGVRVYEAYEVK